METEPKRFLLPKLCAIKPILMLVVGAELLTIILILATGDILLESWDELGLLSVFVQGIVLASAGLVCTLRQYLEKMSLTGSIISVYIIVMLVTIMVAGITKYFLNNFIYATGDSSPFFHQFASRSFIISAILTAAALRYFYVQQQWKRRVELESQARMQALQARIRPHFLFNSMNIIASLIPTQPDLAEQVVEDLSELFRATLQETGSFVALSEEQNLSQHYIRIEKLRLGSRLEVVWALSGLPMDAAVPMLLLQPLLENAVYHGIQPLPEGGTVRVEGQFDGVNIEITVSNPVSIGSVLKKHSGHGIALENIKHRLDLLFGQGANLSVKTGEGVYTVFLHFPYINISDVEKK